MILKNASGCHLSVNALQGDNDAVLERARLLSQALNLALQYVNPEQASAESLFLQVSAQGLSLQQGGHKAPGAVAVDFQKAALLKRLKTGDKMLGKALGCKRGKPYRILDATAGFAVDAALMAGMGFEVTLLERNPVVAALLDDGIQRARVSDDLELCQLSQRMHLRQEDGLGFLNHVSRHKVFDVIYLDPMFPERKKSAQVKKGMQYFHQLVGADADADQLLPLALRAARHRVVVKRPRIAPSLADQPPSFQLLGKAHRYDVYALKAF